MNELIGKRFSIRARSETTNVSAVYDGVILAKVGDDRFVVELIGPDKKHVLLMPIDSFTEGKTPPSVISMSFT